MEEFHKRFDNNDGDSQAEKDDALFRQTTKAYQNTDAFDVLEKRNERIAWLQKQIIIYESAGQTAPQTLHNEIQMLLGMNGDQ